jgi:hypothetical protein
MGERSSPKIDQRDFVTPNSRKKRRQIIWKLTIRPRASLIHQLQNRSALQQTILGNLGRPTQKISNAERPIKISSCLFPVTLPKKLLIVVGR